MVKWDDSPGPGATRATALVPAWTPISWWLQLEFENPLQRHSRQKTTLLARPGSFNLLCSALDR